jgi:sec-independent protein translocase protein TatB
MDFLGVGTPEILIVLIVALIVLGPERLPEVAGKVARAIREVRATTQGFTDQITRELQLEEWERKAREMEAEARRATQLTPLPPAPDQQTIAPPAIRSDEAFAVPRSPAEEPVPAPALVESPPTAPSANAESAEPASVKVDLGKPSETPQ